MRYSGSIFRHPKRPSGRAGCIAYAVFTAGKSASPGMVTAFLFASVQHFIFTQAEDIKYLYDTNNTPYPTLCRQ